MALIAGVVQSVLESDILRFHLPIKLQERPKKRAPAAVDLLPVFVCSHPSFDLTAARVVFRGTYDFGGLNSIDRWRQWRQFWSFVFHDFHLLSLLRLTIQLAS